MWCRAAMAMLMPDWFVRTSWRTVWSSMLVEPTLRRIDKLAASGHPGAKELATYFVGQGVGLMNKVKPARDVVLEFIEDYLAATQRLSNSLPD